MRWQVFLINLDHSTTRLERSKEMLDSINLEFERIPAVWGADLTQEQIDLAYDAKSRNSHYKELNTGEVGCYLSHIKAWELIVERDLDFALVLEDDFLLHDCDFPALLEALTKINEPWYYIKLGGYHKNSDLLTSQKLNKYTLSTFKKVPNRTCAQFVSKEGAKRLLATSKPFGRPIDIDLRYWWEKNITVQALLPYSFMPNRQIESEIIKISRRKSSKKRP